jgi:tetratricopeptide (TPR) repeat protein
VIEALLQAERLLVHGMVDQAEQIYQRTLDGDPQNAIALVGLARVALERGDDRAAYRRACDALEIDRRNPAALRLEARLSEVLSARGEAVERPQWLAASTPAAPPSEPAGEPPQPAASAPVGRESEQAVLARNPSMADHRRMQQSPPRDDAPRRDPAISQPAPAKPRRRRPRGILRRLLGG